MKFPAFFLGFPTIFLDCPTFSLVPACSMGCPSIFRGFPTIFLGRSQHWPRFSIIFLCCPKILGHISYMGSENGVCLHKHSTGDDKLEQMGHHILSQFFSESAESFSGAANRLGEFDNAQELIANATKPPRRVWRTPP